MDHQRQYLELRLRTAEGDREWALEYGDTVLLSGADFQIVECNAALKLLSEKSA